MVHEELFQKTPRILIIDDQPTNIRLLHALLHDQYDIFMATDGAQCLQKCKDLLPDIILLDVVMPGLNGYEVCMRLKADPITADIPVIFISAHFDEAEEAKGFELGAVDFIHKPINPVITKARIATHLAHKLQNDLLRSLALIDGLTGVFNRRKFDEDLQADWLDGVRQQTPLSLILLDIDYFKLYNDKFGHLMGDTCLRLIAQTIRQVVQRPYDLVARYGGEEFVCLLPDTSLSGAAHLAEQILSAVQALGIDGPRGVVTLSAGVACTLPAADNRPETLVEVADQQLYLSKSAGRGRWHSTEC